MLEPWLYGSSTGLSPVAVLVAAVVWTTLWGPVGLLLSTPLTVCLVVLGRHVPQLAFFDVLLGDEPALPPELKFYQRLLARDPDEATELAEEYLEDEPLEKLYDGVIIPALGLAEQDRLRGSLDRATVQGMAEDTIGIVEYLIEEEERDPGTGGGRGCLATGRADRGCPRSCASAPAMASTRRRPRCWRTCSRSAASAPRQSRATRLAGRNLTRLPRHGVGLICLSYVNPQAIQHAQRLTRRLRRHFGERTRIMVGLWMAEPSQEAQELLDATGADLIATSLRHAAREVQELMAPGQPEATPSAA